MAGRIEHRAARMKVAAVDTVGAPSAGATLQAAASSRLAISAGMNRLRKNLRRRLKLACSAESFVAKERIVDWDKRTIASSKHM